MFKGPEDGEMIAALLISLGTIVLAAVGLALAIVLEVAARIL